MTAYLTSSTSSNELEISLQALVTRFEGDEENLNLWETMLKDKQNTHNALHNQWLILHYLHHELQPQLKHIGQL